MKKILIISSSNRFNSNSHAMAEAFAKGAESAGNMVEIICLRDKKIEFCRGCMACVKTNRCLIADDMAEILAKMHDADILVFASPVFYYNISGNMKTLLDRTLPLFGTDYRFREVYLLSAAGEQPNDIEDHSLASIRGWADCFPGVTVKNCLYAYGVNLPGEIKDKPILDDARKMGAEA